MNLDEYLSTHLKEGERLVRIVRQHPAVLLPSLLGGGLTVLLDFFFLAWWFRHHGWGALGFVLFLVLPALWIVRALYLWRYNVLVITTDRVIDIDQRGFFERHVAEAQFSAIQDIRYSIRGVWSTLFHFGTIVLQTAGRDGNLDLRFVADPVELQQQLADLQQNRRSSSSGPLSATDLVKMVDQLKSALPPGQLDALLKRSPHASDDQH